MIDVPTRALTLWQPWAWAIFHAGKNVENRTWHPPGILLGRTLAIHASTKRSRGEIAAYRATVGGDPPPLESMEYGAILGWVTVSGCMGPRSRRIPDDVEYASMSKNIWQSAWWFTDQYGWILRDPVALATPYPIRGRQGIWSLPTEAIEFLTHCVKGASL